MKIYHARGIRFINSKITVENGKALMTYDAKVTGLGSTAVPPQP
jgi:hypothetical protein